MKSMKTLKAAIAAAVLTASTPALAEVTFGALFPFSGGLALLGEESARGLEIAVDEINARGGGGAGPAGCP